MASASLSAELRSDKGKGVSRKLRAAGRVPGVIYGHAREAQGLRSIRQGGWVWAAGIPAPSGLTTSAIGGAAWGASAL